MHQKLLALAFAGFAAAALPGCKPQPPVEPTAPVATTAPAAPAEAAPIVAASTAPALDRKGFAGKFASGSSAVTLAADGTFKLEQGAAAFNGTWTTEADGAKIRLDPDSKAEADRLYGVVGQDEILPLDAAGLPIEGGTSLKRENSEY